MKKQTQPGQRENGYSHLLIDFLPLGILETDRENVITYSNKALHNIMDCGSGELQGQQLWDLLPTQEGRESLKNHFQSLEANEQSNGLCQFKFTKKDGRSVDLQIKSHCVFDDEVHLESTVSVITDISHFKEKETSLIRNVEGLAALQDASKSLLATLDLDTILQATVDGTSKLSGLDTAAIYLLQDEKLYLHATTPPLPPQFPDELREAQLSDHPHIKKAIDSRQVVLVPDVKGEGHDLTLSEKTVAEQRNLRTLMFLPLIARDEVMGALIVGSIGQPTIISKEEISLSFTFANLAALAVKNSRLFRDGVNYAAQLERTLEERDRAEEERENLQKQLIQVQKMEAIGQLAGGIAHDFNNQLTGILGFAELLHQGLSDTVQRQQVEHIMRIAERSANLTAQLLAFSRKGQFQNVEVDLHDIVNEVISILECTISRTIEIQKRFIPKPCVVIGDPNQIQNALLNIGLNARDAMSNKGELLFATEHVFINNQDWEKFGIRLRKGWYIQLSISDTGTGIDPAIIDHIFEPFFTTKGPGEGTGMGLSAAYGTMKSHRGDISVYSEPGLGTTFKLYFPLEPSLQSEIYDVSSEEGNETCLSGIDSHSSKQILIVDDEEAVTYTVAEFLKGEGYQVQAFSESQEALSYFERNFRSVSLVIIDLIMPKMDGSELYQRMKSVDPQVSVLLSSGFGINIVAKLTQEEGLCDFIQKPFHRVELLKAVRNALSRRAAEHTAGSDT